MAARQGLGRSGSVWRIVQQAFVVLLFAPVAEGWAQTPADLPLLRIETGAHLAQILAAATDANGRVLVTASMDKTARIWSLPDLRPLGVLRPSINAEEGFVYAVAVSPNGRLAAIGGWFGHDATDGVMLFDLQTQQVVHRFGELPSAVNALAFSVDGSRLAAGIGNSVRIWRIADATLLMRDDDYRDTVHGLAFTLDGHLATASFDGALRLYDAKGRLERTVPTEAGREPFHIRFSPDGRLLGITFYDALTLEVRDGATLVLRYRPEVGGLSGKWFEAVAWSADGRTFYAGGAASPSSTGPPPVFAWADAGAGPRRIAAATLDSFALSNIVPLSDQRLVVTTLIGSLAVVNGDGERLAERRPGAGNLSTTVDLAGATRHLRLSNTGAQVEWVFFDAPERWLRFDATTADLSSGATPLPGLTDWFAETSGLKVTDWNVSSEPKLNGKPLPLVARDSGYSTAVAPGHALLGTGWYLHLFDADAKALWPKPIPIPGVAYRVNLSRDGRIAVAALGDGTIRWYRVSDGGELLALFVTPDAQRWVAFTPSGYFAASPGGEGLIGWHVNRGADRPADFFPAQQFRSRFYRPDVVTRVLATLDETEALRQADAVSGARSPSATEPSREVLARLPPVVTIVAPADGATVPATGEAHLRVDVRFRAGTSINGLRVLADGRPLASARIGAARALPSPAPGENSEEREIELDLSAFAGHDVPLAVVAQSDIGSSMVARLLLRVAPPPLATVPQEKRKPVLYGVIAGVSAYEQEALRLKFAAKDARDLRNTLLLQKDGLYRDVQLVLLEDGQVNRRALLEALAWLERSTTSSDTAVMFLAGHGVNTADKEYFFLPVDADLDHPEITGISATDLLRPLRTMAGKVIVFLDTCYGGALFGTRWRAVPDMTNVLNEMLAGNEGIVAYSATTGTTRAEERDDLGNGVFTHVLLGALSSQPAGANAGRVISVSGLADYLPEEVKRLTAGRQKAAFISPEGMESVPIFITMP